VAIALLFAAPAFAAKGSISQRTSSILEQSLRPCHSAGNAAGGLAITSQKALLDKNP